MPSDDERPWTVKAFETIALILVIADLVVSKGFSFDDLIWIPLYLWMILSITRKKSALARSIFTALCLPGLLVALVILLRDSGNLPTIGVVDGMIAVALGLAAAFHLWLIWSTPTSRWLATRHQFEPKPHSEER